MLSVKDVRLKVMQLIQLNWQYRAGEAGVQFLIPAGS